MRTLPSLRAIFLQGLGLTAFALMLTSCKSSGDLDGTGIVGAGIVRAGSGKSTLFLEDAYWGRLVDIFDKDGVLHEADVVIREFVQDDGVTYELGANPITQKETLTISFAQGTTAFDAAVASATAGLSSLQAKDFDAPAPFTKVARNGAIKLVFTEYVDPVTVDRQTIQVLVGTSEENFQSKEVRYIVKQGVGQNGEPRGIVILDSTISRLDSEASGVPENGIGLPESNDTVNPNLKLRIPTAVNPYLNQNIILTNLDGSQGFAVQRNESGSILEPHEFAGFDPVSVRALRSGNKSDAYNGFLADHQAPSLIVTQDVTIASVAVVGTLRTLTYAIDALNCRPISPKVGDVFEVGDAILQVASVVDATDDSAYVVTASLLTGTLAGGGVGTPGFLTTAYSLADANVQLCFLTFTPDPVTLPAEGVDPFSTISVRFSEPVDVGTVRSLDSFVLASTDDTNSVGGELYAADDEWNSGEGEMVGDYIDRLPGFSQDTSVSGSGRIMFGPISVTGDAQGYTMAPVSGISDPFGAGSSIELTVALRDGSSGILDLSGNSMGFSGFVAGHSSQTLDFTLDGTPPSDSYFALRGNGVDEDGDHLPEYGGQLGNQLGDGILRARALSRFSRQADNTNLYIGQRLKFTFGLMTPLVPAGSVLQTLWAYHHLGFGLTAEAEFNIDVEGLNWSPYEGILYDDTFERYSVALAHSSRFPDDYISPTSGYPAYPNSGLKRLSSNKFDDNIFGYGDNPTTYADLDEVICFDTSYSVSSVNQFQTAGGTYMYPWPDFQRTYTWRDTSFPKPNGTSLKGGSGADYGVPPATIGGTPVYNALYYPSVALPLLMRYRCYPRGGEWGYNGFQVSIMVGSSNRPAFRVFSSGGLPGGSTSYELVYPDLPTSGTNPEGGYNTLTGDATKGWGPELYWGQADFVTRISRLYTHWFHFGGSLDTLSNVTLEPTLTQANPGTSVEVEYRAASLVDTSPCGAEEPSALTDAFGFDAYGDYLDDGCGSVIGAGDWTSDAADLATQGLPYFQLRFTFVANIDQDLEAELDAFGFAYTTN